jgi:hypothetical protein
MTKLPGCCNVIRPLAMQPTTAVFSRTCHSCKLRDQGLARVEQLIGTRAVPPQHLKLGIYTAGCWTVQVGWLYLCYSESDS